MSQPRKKDLPPHLRDQDPRPVKLIPELCYMTGLTDRERASFKLMSDLGQYTRADPQKRTENLMQFARRIAQTQAAQQVLQKWGLKMDGQLVKVPGRIIKPEQIQWGHKQVSTYKLDNAQWPLR